MGKGRRASVYMDSYVPVDFGARTANKVMGQRERERGSAWKQSPLVNFGALRVVVVVVVAVVAFLPAQRAQTDNVAVFRFVCVWVVFFSGQPLATCHMALATCHTRQSAVVMKTKNERRKKSEKEAAAATGCDFVIRAGNAPRLAFDTHSKYVCKCECVWVCVWACLPSWTWSWGTAITFESFLCSSNSIAFFHCIFTGFSTVYSTDIPLGTRRVRDAAWTLRIRRLSQDKPIEAAAPAHTAKILTPDPTMPPTCPDALMYAQADNNNKGERERERERQLCFCWWFKRNIYLICFCFCFCSF